MCIHSAAGGGVGVGVYGGRCCSAPYESLPERSDPGAAPRGTDEQASRMRFIKHAVEVSDT